MALIAPSILSADFARLGEELHAVTRAGADLIHIDVMDGHFVPNITLGPPVIRALRSHSALPFDVHLMIAQPQGFIEDFAAAGAQIISVQVEACTHLHRTIQAIRQAGCRPAVALNPATPLEAITYVLGEVEMILLMTVNPGFGGQQFIPAVLPKIESLRALIDRENLPVKIQTDGGVNEDTIAQAARAGCDIFVAGTAVFGQPDYARAIKGLRQKADEARREQKQA
jgi:ribulose-phosphate 3-epimerase